MNISMNGRSSKRSIKESFFDSKTFHKRTQSSRLIQCQNKARREEKKRPFEHSRVVPDVEINYITLMQVSQLKALEMEAENLELLRNRKTAISGMPGQP